MSTAQINIQVNNSIAGVMDQAKQKIKEEVKKKVMKVVNILKIQIWRKLDNKLDKIK